MNAAYLNELQISRRLPFIKEACWHSMEISEVRTPENLPGRIFPIMWGDADWRPWKSAHIQGPAQPLPRQAFATRRACDRSYPISWIFTDPVTFWWRACNVIPLLACSTKVAASRSLLFFYTKPDHFHKLQNQTSLNQLRQTNQVQSSKPTYTMDTIKSVLFATSYNDSIRY